MTRDRSPPRVLIVDDQPGNIRVLAEALDTSYEIQFANNGRQALELALAEPPDLVLLDVVMPVMGGFEVCHALKSDARTRHVPVIFVTTLGELEDEERGFALGAVDYITKPISPSTVRARTRTHIELKRQRDLLDQLASYDPLTGIANRRQFEDALLSRWDDPVQSAQAHTLVLIDIDHFKAYIEAYGHGDGDDCLRAVGAALGNTFCATGELAARYGGDEFALLLPGNDGAAHAARLQRCIAELDLHHQLSPLGGKVTTSAGSVDLIPRNKGERASLDIAARLLTEARRDGGNRCIHQRLADGERLIIKA